MTRLATQYGRYGYRRITELLRREGWKVNHKRVARSSTSDEHGVPLLRFLTDRSTEYCGNRT